jgi:hypothetical protein
MSQGKLDITSIVNHPLRYLPCIISTYTCMFIGTGYRCYQKEYIFLCPWLLLLLHTYTWIWLLNCTRYIHACIWLADHDVPSTLTIHHRIHHGCPSCHCSLYLVTVYVRTEKKENNSNTTCMRGRTSWQWACTFWLVCRSSPTWRLEKSWWQHPVRAGCRGRFVANDNKYMPLRIRYSHI